MVSILMNVIDVLSPFPTIILHDQEVRVTLESGVLFLHMNLLVTDQVLGRSITDHQLMKKIIDGILQLTSWDALV
jgi:hypothetical protein